MGIILLPSPFPSYNHRFRHSMWGTESRLSLASKPGKVAMEVPLDPVAIGGQVQQGLGEGLVTSQELLGTLLCSILFALLSPFFLPFSFHLSDDHLRDGGDEC